MRWRMAGQRSLAWSVLAVMTGLSVVSGLAQAAPASVHDWLTQEHAFLRRYQLVVRQGAHDYRYDYQTPPLLLPVAIDLFTGCVVHHHLMEEQFLYPVLRSHMTAEQQKLLDLVTHDQQTESDTVKGLERQLAQHQPDAKLSDEAETLDYLDRMIGRHTVLQEEQLYPVVETLTPAEQAAILKGIASYERDTFGPTGRQRYEQLLAYLEAEIKRIVGRVW